MMTDYKVHIVDQSHACATFLSLSASCKMCRYACISLPVLISVTHPHTHAQTHTSCLACLTQEKNNHRRLWRRQEVRHRVLFLHSARFLWKIILTLDSNHPTYLLSKWCQRLALRRLRWHTLNYCISSTVQ